MLRGKSSADFPSPSCSPSKLVNIGMLAGVGDVRGLVEGITGFGLHRLRRHGRHRGRRSIGRPHTTVVFFAAVRIVVIGPASLALQPPAETTTMPGSSSLFVDAIHPE